MPKILFLLVMFSAGPIWSDTINYDLIFAEKYEGVVSCHDAAAESYCGTDVNLYDQTGKTLNKRSQLQVACLTGGGDCDARVLLLQTKDLSTGETLGLAKNQNKENVWIKVKKSNVTNLIPPKEENVEFNKSLKFVFLDKKMTQKISVNEALKPDKELNYDPKKEKVVIKEIFSEKVDNKKMIGLLVEIIELDPEENGIATPKENGYRRRVREIYFPAYDVNGVINYWYSTPWGC